MSGNLKLALGAAVLLTASAAPALAASPEKDAVDTFASFCVVTNGNPAAIDKAMEEVTKAKSGGRIDAGKLTASTGVKADNAWALKVGESGQQLLLTTYQGICALHLNSGDAEPVKAEFGKLADMVATTAKGKLTPLKQEKKDKNEIALYRIGKSGPSAVLGISTASEVSPSGTKHLLSFTPMAVENKTPKKK